MMCAVKAGTADVLNLFKGGREKFLDRNAEAGAFNARLFSASTYALWKAARAVVNQYCHGLVLDAGSGRGAWRSTILETASGYESVDVAPRGGNRPTWVGDIMAMTEIPSERYDVVACQQVLEHVRHPWRAASQFHRVLKPGGVLVLSVPHLSRRHERPHDYFRFTPEGVAILLEDAGFDLEYQSTYGGLLSFLHHQTSFFFPGLLLGIPLIGKLALLLNAPFSWLMPALDRILDPAPLFPLGIIVVARKPDVPSGSSS